MLLLEKRYEAVSMRDIAGVAGVAPGTLYLYFPNKDSMAAVTVRRCARRVGEALAQANPGQDPCTMRQATDAIATAYAHCFLDQPQHWKALISLERRISSAESYQQLYRQHVEIVRDALVAASDWPASADADTVAFTVFTIVDGMVRHALLIQPQVPEEPSLVREIRRAVDGYLQQALAPAEPPPEGRRQKLNTPQHRPAFRALSAREDAQPQS
ncbi:TetR/AcrR family transcriptional regulator [Variovorax rhizosphaerae]|uniref:TetR/AcrR family transcriptional regulator n=1 Tax=Variovorax rhizosphaerae TaxID=1836200 RepID=A0ABU8WUV0_9BURK